MVMATAMVRVTTVMAVVMAKVMLKAMHDGDREFYGWMMR
jgi:hypothetical protein